LSAAGSATGDNGRVVLPGSPSPSLPEARCSARGCRAPAAWALGWNNPAVHTPDRRKVWLACEDHREHLSGFLGVRGFLRDCVPFEPGPGAS
jgi:hypothetical protein